jgi:hypothetical protein
MDRGQKTRRGSRVASTEDELAKKQVQEAVWAWAGRIIVLSVTFGFGFFAAWVLWGSGTTGAPALRTKVEQIDAQMLEAKNKNVDVGGRLTVCEGRLSQANTDLQKCRNAAAAPAPAAP